MKVLWFSPTSALYHQRTNGHNGGGWISSLELKLRSYSNVKLGIVFELNSPASNEMIDGVEYFPLLHKPVFAERLNRELREQQMIKKAILIIDEFKPDIIQIFGSESWYGQLVNHTKIPIVVHMQGFLPSYFNARYPVGMSVWNKVFSRVLPLKQKLMAFRIDDTFKLNASREEQTLRDNRYFMGRTHWDRAIVELYNSDARYFHCDEMIRDSFLGGEKWEYKKRDKLRIISTISGPLYKGVDLILKTADLLKRYSNLDFEWNVCGVSGSAFVEEHYSISASDVNVNYCGVVEERVLRELLLDSSLYVHPSYIDNSPNSVCEAQLIGVPVISTNVGGIASLIDDGVSGFLVPANDPVILAHKILKMHNDAVLLSSVSKNAVEQAMKRHNPSVIIERVMGIYNELVG